MEPYANDTLRCWLLTAGESDAVVRIDVMQVDTERGYDRVRLFDGVTFAAATITELSGTDGKHATFYSSGRALLVHFRSDRTVSGHVAFYADYVPAFPELSAVADDDAEAEATRLTADYAPAHLTSPQYPLAYPNSLDRYWLIQANRRHHGHVIWLHVIEFETEKYFDFVALYDGASTSTAPLLARLTGLHQNNTEFYSSGPALLVYMHTDEVSATFLGVHFTYQVVMDVRACRRGESVSLTPEQEITVATSGVHSKHMSCLWRFKSPPGTTVRVEIEKLHLYDKDDELAVYDGLDGRHEIARCHDAVAGLCGLPLVTRSVYAEVRFQTGGETTAVRRLRFVVLVDGRVQQENEAAAAEMKPALGRMAKVMW